LHRAHLARAAWVAHLMPCDPHLMPSVVDETAQCSSGPCCLYSRVTARSGADASATPTEQRLGRRGRQHFDASTISPALCRQHFVARDSADAQRGGRQQQQRACSSSDRAQPDSAESHSVARVPWLRRGTARQRGVAQRGCRGSSADCAPQLNGRGPSRPPSRLLHHSLPYQTPLNPPALARIRRLRAPSTSLPS
jgi:hypothetical protein